MNREGLDAAIGDKVVFTAGALSDPELQRFGGGSFEFRGYEPLPPPICNCGALEAKGNRLAPWEMGMVSHPPTCNLTLRRKGASRVRLEDIDGTAIFCSISDLRVIQRRPRWDW